MTPGHSCPALCRPLGTFGPHRAACKVPLAWVTAAFRLRSGGSTESPGERKVEGALWSRGLHVGMLPARCLEIKMPRAGVSSVGSTVLAKAGMQGYGT